MKVIATDLDGTLLGSDGVVSRRTRETLRRAVDRGLRHVIVTGRPASGCAPYFTALSYTGLAVCGQGAQLYDAGTGQLLTATGLDRTVARAALRRLAERVGPLDLAVVTSGLDGEFVIAEGFGRGDEPALSPYRLVPAERLWDQPIDKVLLRHCSLPDADLAAAAVECAGAGTAVTHAGPQMVELLPTGFDKATGLAQVVRSFGLGAADVIAFGDMPNDLPMLDWAGYAVAMANGHPELKAVADEVAPANDDDGVARILERILDLGDQGVTL